jgi:hypothetical protein
LLSILDALPIQETGRPSQAYLYQVWCLSLPFGHNPCCRRCTSFKNLFSFFFLHWTGK